MDKIQYENDYEEYLKSYYPQVKKLNEMDFWIGNPLVDILNGKLKFQKYSKDLQLQNDRIPHIYLHLITCLTIPNSKMPIEFCEFLQPYITDVNEIKVLKIESFHCYGIVIQVNSIKNGIALYNEKQQQRFNQLETEICIFRVIEEITFSSDNNEDNFFYQKGVLKKIKKGNRKKYQESDQCTICLDPLISNNFFNSPIKQTLKTSKAIISILCGHYFHLSCLSQWSSTGCPICRYDQQPPQVSFCEICNSSENLWLCLICGHKSCGQDLSKDADCLQHYQQSLHQYAMSLESKLVYDFQSMNYVHRILVNQFDGQLIQHSGFSKEDKLGKEYEYKVEEFLREQENFLQISLESQRDYFEQLIQNLKKTKQEDIQSFKEKIMEQREQIKQQEQELDKINEEYEQEQKEVQIKKVQFMSLLQEKTILQKENKDLQNDLNAKEKQKKKNEQNQLDQLAKIKAEIQSTQLEVRKDQKIFNKIKDIQGCINVRKKMEKQGLEKKELNDSQLIMVQSEMQGKKNKNKKRH